MATTITPQFIQVSSYFNAVDLRDAANKPAWEGVREGISQYSHLLTTAGGGGNLSVDVSAGVCYVRGDSQIDQGLYRCEFDTDNNLPLSTADATHPRVDRIVVTVRDNTYDASGYYEAKLQVRTGTPTSGATLTNLTGAQALTDSEILIADVLVNAGATAPSSISTAVRSLLGYGLQPPTNQTKNFDHLLMLGAYYNVDADRNDYLANGTSLTEAAQLISVDGLSEHYDVEVSEWGLSVTGGNDEILTVYPVIASATIESADTFTLPIGFSGGAHTKYYEAAIYDVSGAKLAHTNFVTGSANPEILELTLSATIDLVAGEIYWVAFRIVFNTAGAATLNPNMTTVYTPRQYKRGRVYSATVSTSTSQQLNSKSTIRSLGTLTELSMPDTSGSPFSQPCYPPLVAVGK